MHRSLFAVLGLALCTRLGATAAFADTSALGKFPGAKQAIMSYCPDNARGGDGNCNAGQMADIGDAQVVSASGDTAAVAVDYTYSARSNAGTNACSGMGWRKSPSPKTAPAGALPE